MTTGILIWRKPNNPGECNAFVAELHDLAIKNDCPISCVIHFNPNSDKPRGHLGSQLERKSETNLVLEKAEEVTELYSSKQRRAPIPKGTGPCFQWSDEAGMHVSTGTRKESIEEEKRSQHVMMVDDVFSGHPSMRFSDIISTVNRLKKCKDRTSERLVGKWVKLGLIHKSVAGLYVRTP
jgi:hypothetical protein